MYNVDLFIEATEAYRAGLKAEPDSAQVTEAAAKIHALAAAGGFTYHDVANDVNQEALIWRIEAYLNRK